jgi:hypothetical protein
VEVGAEPNEFNPDREKTGSREDIKERKRIYKLG